MTLCYWCLFVCMSASPFAWLWSGCALHLFIFWNKMSFSEHAQWKKYMHNIWCDVVNEHTPCKCRTRGFDVIAHARLRWNLVYIYNLLKMKKNPTIFTHLNVWQISGIVEVHNYNYLYHSLESLQSKRSKTDFDFEWNVKSKVQPTQAREPALS